MESIGLVRFTVAAKLGASDYRATGNGLVTSSILNAPNRV